MNLGLPEMIFIFLLALLIFGPRKLPEIGRQIGKSLAQFKRASNEFRSQIEDEMQLMEREEKDWKTAPPPPEGTVANSIGASPQPPPAEGSSAAAPAGGDPQPEDPAHPAGHSGVEGA